jgi:polysaccharide biosynthesis/export protein
MLLLKMGFRGLILAVVAFVAATGVQAGYRVKPGDVLEVLVYQDEKLNRQVVVAPDGQISFPLAGHVRAAGLTVETIEATLTRLLKPKFADELDVTVLLAAVKEIPIPPPVPEKPLPPPIDPSFFVTGEVAKPGQYYFKTRTNVLQAISMAGGLGPFAADKRIVIRRKEGDQEVLYEFNYDSFVSGKDLSGNMRLHSGDVIIVPERKLFE